MALTLSLAAIALFAGAAASDLARRKIPNRLVVALAGLGLVRVLWGAAVGAGLGGLGADLAAAVAVFAAGAAVFQFGLIGGGDVKLLAAGALWLGAAAVGPYLVATALAGAGLALLFLGLSLVAPPSRGGRPSLPYGVAIAAGGILATAGAI